jgi:hypothetical protein
MSVRLETTLAGYARAPVDLKFRMTDYSHKRARPKWSGRRPVAVFDGEDTSDANRRTTDGIPTRLYSSTASPDCNARANIDQVAARPGTLARSIHLMPASPQDPSRRTQPADQLQRP